MSKMRPENVFLTVALSVIGVAAVAGYIGIVARTYDSEDRIPTPEEYALTVRTAEPETAAPVLYDTLSAAPEEKEPAEIMPEEEAPPAVVPEAEEPEPADTDDTPETTLEEWFALLEERYTPRKYEHETEADETTFDEWIAALEASIAAEPKEPDPAETTFEEWLELLDQRYPIDGSAPVRSTDSGSSGGGASISYGVSSLYGPFVDIKTDENSSVTVTRTEDGYSSVVTYSDGEGTTSMSGIFIGGIPEDFRSIIGDVGDTLDAPTVSLDVSDDGLFDINIDRTISSTVYPVNTKNKVIHMPDCSWVDQIATENYSTTTDPEELIGEGIGYRWCQKCHKGD